VHSSTDLPDDVESLKRLVLESRAALRSRDLEIQHLKLLLAKLRRMQFGRSSDLLGDLRTS
jgi:transposase